jgi:hypothetical protein
MASSNLQEHLADIDAHVQYVRQDVMAQVGDIIYQGVDGEPARLAIGFPLWVLTVDPNSPLKPTWLPPNTLGLVPISIFQHKGDILTCDGAGHLVIVPVGSPGQYLTPDPTHLGGLKWAALPVVVGTCSYSLRFNEVCNSGYVGLL